MTVASNVMMYILKASIAGFYHRMHGGLFINNIYSTSLKKCKLKNSQPSGTDSTPPKYGRNVDTAECKILKRYASSKLIQCNRILLVLRRKVCRGLSLLDVRIALYSL